MRKEDVRNHLLHLIEARERAESQIKETVFEYCKMEGLVPSSLEIENFGYKNKIREVFGLVI